MAIEFFIDWLFFHILFKTHKNKTMPQQQMNAYLIYNKAGKWEKPYNSGLTQ